MAAAKPAVKPDSKQPAPAAKATATKGAAPAAVAAAPKKLVLCVKSADDLKDKPQAVSAVLAQWENNEGTEAEWVKVVNDSKLALVDGVLQHFEALPADVTVSGDVVHLLHVFAHLSPKVVAQQLLKSCVVTKPLVEAEPVRWTWQKAGSTVTMGPVSKEDLKREWETKKITPETKVWRDGAAAFQPIKELPSLVAYLSGANSVKRRVVASPVSPTKLVNDEMLLVWRLQLLAAALNPANALELKTLVEAKERTDAMNDLLTQLPERRPEVQALLAQCLFLLEAVDPEAALLHTESAAHPNAQLFAKILVVLFNAKDTSTLAPAGEFVDASVKRAGEQGDGKDLFFESSDVDQLQTSLWRVVAATRDDQVFLQSVVTIQTIVKHSPKVWPDVKFLTHLNELKARCYGLAQTKKNDDLVVTLATEIQNDIAALLRDNVWLGKQRPPSPKATKGKLSAAAKANEKSAPLKAPKFAPAKTAAKPAAAAPKPAAPAATDAKAPAKLVIPFDKADYDALMEANNAAADDVLTLDTDAVATKVERFNKLFAAGDGTEAEWNAAVEANDWMLPTTLGLVLANVKSLSAAESEALVNNIMILSSIAPDEIGSRLSTLRGFVAAVVAHIKPHGRLPPEAEAAEMGNWQLESEKSAEQLAKEKALADAKAKRAAERDAAERAASIFEARLNFVLGVCLSAPDAVVETRVAGASEVCAKLFEVLVFEGSAMAMEAAGAVLILLNIMDAARTPLKEAGTKAKPEQRQALMESAYKLINRAEEDARVPLTGEQRTKLEWASLVWVQSVVAAHSEYFYRSDVQVLVDSLLRRGLDSGVDVLLPEYLKTLGALCSWKGYPRDRDDETRLHKADEITAFYDNLANSVSAVVPPTDLTNALAEQIVTLAEVWEQTVAANNAQS